MGIISYIYINISYFIYAFLYIYISYILYIIYISYNIYICIYIYVLNKCRYECVRVSLIIQS